MHRPQISLYAATALAMVLQTTIAVSLDDFTPRATNLPTACETIYSSTIDDCKPSDFATSGSCSTSCIAALEALTVKVKAQCSSVDGDNILTAMLAGEGTLQICSNADTSLSASSSTAASSKTSSSASSTTQKTETPVIGAGTMVLSQAAVSTSGLLIDTSSVTGTAVSSRSQSAATTSLAHAAEAQITTSSTTLAVVTVTASSVIAANTSAGVLFDDASATATGSASKTASSSASSATSSSDTEGGSPMDVSGSARLHTSTVAVAASLLAVVIGALLL